ncbi:DUF6710 family protein [Alkalibacillus haloalkaliphilus]|uniref:DUF6710 family protein n=1 Tax=Alkalibacillus haloalkaliphilus TaxID=94136 RepID=UPI0002E281AE|nr:DUF6710 family protein [Alkalibacillus haloalkaliphilus]
MFLRKSSENDQIEKFNRILRFSEGVFSESKNGSNTYVINNNKGNEHPILDVIKLVGKNLQSQYLTNLLTVEDESELPPLLPSTVFFDQSEILNSKGDTTINMLKEVSSKSVDLKKDLVLPWPWKKERLIASISNLGTNRDWGGWQQDYNNHHLEVWLPMGVAWVRGGNHSITVGILQGEGTIIPDVTYDFREVYKYVYTDGKYYYRSEDDSKICKVKNVEFAAMFEVGRMMVEQSITY